MEGKTVYKCCYNCDGGFLAAVPQKRTESNAYFYDKLIEINKTKRFCAMNYRDDGCGKDMYKQRYCKNFEVKKEYKGEIISKKEALRRVN